MLARIALMLAALAYAPLGAAHHGWSEYDASKTLTLSGEIRESGYEHPHGHITLEAAGKVWHVVLAPPSRMQSRGLPRGALKPGSSVTVVGYQNRNDPSEMRAERITVGEKTIELR